MTILETTMKMQDQVLDAINYSQESLLSAVKAVAENMAPLTDKLAAVSFADQLPDGVDVVTTGFGFAERLLANNKAFTTKLMEAYSPSKSATKSASKAA